MGFNDHHLLASSRGGSNNACNKRPIDERRHEAIHTLFGNATPIEQLREIVKLNITCLKEEFVEELLTLLECKKPYKCNAVKNRKQLEESNYQTGVSRFPRLYTEE